MLLFWTMDAALPISGMATEESDYLRQISNTMVGHWAKAVEIFRDWERKELLEKTPSEKQIELHRKEGLYLIRMTRCLLNLVSDPESPAREHSKEISGRLGQLEAVFEIIHNPMSDTEAEAIIKEVFPDEPAVRGTA